MMIISELAVTDECLLSHAQDIAQRLHVRINQEASNCLLLSSDHLSLKLDKLKPLYADFFYQTWLKRKSEGKKQGLVRACKPRSGINIIDATAGWGKDAAILASFGAQVLMLERNAIMAALVEDALDRRSELDRTAMNLSMLQVNAIDYLRCLQPEDYPDVIYIDPMHPQRQKSALVKKDMQVLQQMIGLDTDACELIDIARQRVRQRVVVKWPQKLAPLIAADGVVAGKTVRFDLYYPKFGS
jgi:16S rRNA (guanine1516-N2)-methyltransferase